MSRYIWLIISFLLFSTLSMTYTRAMTGEYAPTDGMQAIPPAQGETVEGEVVDENGNGNVQVVQEDEVTRELKTKQHVRNIVDSLLKINKQVEVRSDDPKVKRLMKEQNIGKQIDRLRADIKDLEKTLNSHYMEIKKSSAKNAKELADTDEQTTDSIKQRSRKKKTHSSVTTGKYQFKSWGKTRRSSTSRTPSRRSNIHTVKNVAVPDTNSYLQRIDQKKSTVATTRGPVAKIGNSYKVKCYGKNGSCASTNTTKAAIPQTSTSNTVKKVNYFNPNCGTRSCK